MKKTKTPQDDLLNMQHDITALQVNPMMSKESTLERAPEWNGLLHIGQTVPIRIERQTDGEWHIYTGCCQCRLIHWLHIRKDRDTLELDFRLPDPEAVAHIESARTKAEKDQIARLQDELAAVRAEARIGAGKDWESLNEAYQYMLKSRALEIAEARADGALKLLSMSDSNQREHYRRMCAEVERLKGICVFLPTPGDQEQCAKCGGSLDSHDSCG